MLANDEPHGVLFLNPEQQSIVVMGLGSEVTRALVLNVTRLAGLFGNVSVAYRISGRIDEVMDIKEILGAKADGRLFMREGQPFGAVTMLISSQVRKRALTHICMSKSFKITMFALFQIYMFCFPAVSSVDVFVSG